MKRSTGDDAAEVDRTLQPEFLRGVLRLSGKAQRPLSRVLELALGRSRIVSLGSGLAALTSLQALDLSRMRRSPDGIEAAFFGLVSAFQEVAFCSLAQRRP